MWPFRRKPEPEPKQDVQEHLDDLDDSVRHLERRFLRLQQQFTRWARELDDEIADDPDGEDSPDDVLREILKTRRQG